MNSIFAFGTTNSVTQICTLSVCQLLVASVLASGSAPALAEGKSGESHGSSWSWGYSNNSSWNWGLSYGDKTTGSGKAASERRAVSGFSSVSAHGSMNIVLVQGASEGVTVSADDNIVPLIETTVIDGKNGKTLQIGVKQANSYRTRLPVVVTVDLLRLDSLAIQGSGDVKSAALKTPQLAVSISGSGDIALLKLNTDVLSVAIAGSGDFRSDGRAQTAAFKISGSGDVRASALQAEDVSVSIAGSGDADVSANRSLKVSIAGSGDVSYRGNPTVTQSVAGSGSVKQRVGT